MENWEKEFDKQWYLFPMDDESRNIQQEIKDFIRALLSFHHTHLIEQIEKLKKPKHLLNPSLCRKCAHNTAIDEILSSLSSEPGKDELDLPDVDFEHMERVEKDNTGVDFQ